MNKTLITLFFILGMILAGTVYQTYKLSKLEGKINKYYSEKDFCEN